MVLYAMLLCFHLQSSNKMKESEHKKSTILNFNKTREKKEETSHGVGWGMFGDGEIDRVTAMQSLGVRSKPASKRLHVLHTLDGDAFLHIERFSCSLILYRSARAGINAAFTLVAVVVDFPYFISSVLTCSSQAGELVASGETCEQ